MKNEKPTTLELDPNLEQEKLIDVKEIPDTPFVVVKADKKYFIGMGNERITKEFDSEEEAIESLEHPEWQTLISVMVIVFNSLKGFKPQPDAEPTKK